MSGIWQDLRFAVRFLSRQRTFVILSLLALTVGIGATTAIYSVVDAVLLKPLPYGSPHELVDFFAPGSWSKAEIARIQEYGTAFQSIAGYGLRSATLTGRTEPLLITSIEATGNLFETLKANPLLGKTFARENSFTRRDHVVVVSHRFWKSVLGGVEPLGGQTLEIEGEPYELLGVMPPDFFFPGRNVDLWRPLNMDPAQAGFRGWHSWQLIGRLAEGVTLDRAQESLPSLGAVMRAEFNYSPQWDKFLKDPAFRNFQEAQTGGFRSTLFLLLGAVAAVLLIACVNVANLSLSRIATRLRELSVRRALGAIPARIIRQILIENLLVSLVGGVMGLLLAATTIEAVASGLPAEVLNAGDIHMSWPVLLFGLAAAMLTAFLSGTLPAIQAARQDLQQGLGEGGRASSESRSARRWGSLLVVSEVALGVFLVIGAGLTLRSFVQLSSVDSGLDADQVLVFNTYPTSSAFSAYEKRPQFFEAVSENLRAIPGIEWVGGIQNLPFTASGWIQGLELDDESRDLSVYWRIIEGDYFRSMGIPLLAGRTFDGRDRPGGQDVAIVNQAFVNRYWPGKEPLGQKLQVGTDGKKWMPVVGVVGDVRQEGLMRDPAPMVYRPYAQNPLSVLLTMTLRTPQALSFLRRSIREAVWSVDRDAPVFEDRPMNTVINDSLARRRLLMTLLVAFGGVALLLGMIGVYGVLSYRVNQRFFEVGLRMALGAGRLNVVLMILKQGLGLALVGLLLGLAGAAASARLLEGMLYGISTTDFATYLMVSLLILSAATAACLFPALRAASWDPNHALRSK